jgi:hypothetical protein
MYAHRHDHGDVSPLALNTSENGLEDRAAEIMAAIRTMRPLADAVEALLKR